MCGVGDTTARKTQPLPSGTSCLSGSSGGDVQICSWLRRVWEMPWWSWVGGDGAASEAGGPGGQGCPLTLKNLNSDQAAQGWSYRLQALWQVYEQKCDIGFQNILRQVDPRNFQQRFGLQDRSLLCTLGIQIECMRFKGSLDTHFPVLCSAFFFCGKLLCRTFQNVGMFSDLTEFACALLRGCFRYSFVRSARQSGKLVWNILSPAASFP